MQAKQRVLEGLPIAGIIAFSGCSVNALAHWLLGWSLNPTAWYWLAAVLVEACTAWLVWSVVDTLRMLTKSRISKQDRRFYKIIFLVFTTLAVPSVTASVVANLVEFQGNPLLACLFPVLTIACAVGAGLPDVVKRHKEGQQKEAADRKAERERKKLEAEIERLKRACQVCGTQVGESNLADGKCADCIRSAEGKSHALPHDLSLSVLNRDGWQCFYCGKDLREVPTGERHIDHFVPKSKGGEDVLGNLVTSCQGCNLSKNARDPTEKERWGFAHWLHAKAAGPDKRSQILALARPDENGTVLKQKEIGEILHTSPGWVSTIVREAQKLQPTPPRHGLVRAELPKGDQDGNAIRD